jgi:dihydrofolate reductase
MRKVVASFFISLDGVVEAPQNWHFPYFNDEMGAVVGEAIAASDAFLLGRRTYEEWAAFWPTEAAAESPMAGPMNATPKHVVSTTLDKVEWQNSTLLEGDGSKRPRRCSRRIGLLSRLGCSSPAGVRVERALG